MVPLQEPILLRLIVAASAGATLAYTPVLKRLPGIKNATVASIVAASPLAGALAAGKVSKRKPDQLMAGLADIHGPPKSL